MTRERRGEQTQRESLLLASVVKFREVERSRGIQHTLAIGKLILSRSGVIGGATRITRSVNWLVVTGGPFVNSIRTVVVTSRGAIFSLSYASRLVADT